MSNRIVYLQANENIANSFREEFAAHDLELIIVKSGEEALEIIEREKVLLLLLDINIPDMRFRKLVDRIRAISPQVIINVCIDVLDSLMITKLSNRHHVHKIYVAPWDVDEIIEEVQESLEIAIINEQSNVREDEIISEREELESTLASLTETLKKQQHSYTKLKKLTECFADALRDTGAMDESVEERLAFGEDVFNTLLKMQTTGSFDIDKFETDVRNDLREIKGVAKNFEVGEISSCLMGGQSRSCAQNIRFCIFLIARLYAEFYDTFSVDVSSRYNTTREAEFCIKVTLGEGINEDVLSSHREHIMYVKDILTYMTESSRETAEDNVFSYYCVFLVSRDGQ